MQVVVSKNFELPHTITKSGKEYKFMPDAILPDEYGASLIKTYPDRFREVKAGEKVSVEGYKFAEKFKKQAVVDMFNALDDEQKAAVVEFIGKLNAEKSEGSETAADYNTQSVKQLQALVEQRGITVEGSKKADLVAALEAADKAAADNA